MRKNESGFGIVEIIIIIVIIVALAGLGWYFWQGNRVTTPPVQQTVTTEAAKPAKQSLAIAEWNIGAKNNTDYTLQYKVSTDQRYVYFTAAQLTAATGSRACGIDVVNGVQMGGAGRIARFLNGEKIGEYPNKTVPELAAVFAADPTLKDKYTRVGPYYFFYFGPQAACSDKELGMQQEVNKAVGELMPTLGSVN